jgi:hypothetical protein
MRAPVVGLLAFASSLHAQSPEVSGDVERFVLTWRKAWTESIAGREAGPASSPVSLMPARWGRGGCDRPDWETAMIPAPGNGSKCPVWTLRIADMGFELPSIGDEAIDLDAFLSPAHRQTIRASRSLLIERLQGALRADSTSTWIWGQLTRFLVDNRELDRANEALRSCRAQAWWCQSLKGYVAHAGGSATIADSLLLDGLSMAPDTVRCSWTDLGPLLDPGARPYRSESCGTRRDSINTVIWWLADPFFSDAGNQRRAEHHARHVMVALRSATPAVSERWSWREDLGGAATREMLVRYGWPSVSSYPSPIETRLRHLGKWTGAQDSAGVLTLYDAYSVGRVHSIPDWAAIANVQAFQETQRRLYQPQVDSQMLGSGMAEFISTARRAGAVPEGPLVADRPIGPVSLTRDFRTFPAEHFLRTDGPIKPLPSQVATFRRDSSAIIAVAVLVDTISQLGAGTRATVVAATSTNVSQSEAAFRGTGSVSGQVATLPGLNLAGIEIAALPNGVAFRSRTAITAPQLLSALRPGEVATSQVMFIRPLAGASAVTLDFTAALERMLGTSELAPETVGLYWETYGDLPADSMPLAIRIGPGVRRPGALDRLFGQRVDQDGGVTIRWAPAPAGARPPESMPRTVRGWTVDLNLSTLRPGDYVIETIATARDGRKFSTITPFTIR